MSPASEELEAVIVGGGFCGVALAAALRHFGVSFVLLEAGPQAGAGFSGHYDRLQLHTPRHRLLHDGDLETRGKYPLYKSKSDLVRYLNEYCALHGLVEASSCTSSRQWCQSPEHRHGDGWSSGWAVTHKQGRSTTRRRLPLYWCGTAAIRAELCEP